MTSKTHKQDEDEDDFNTADATPLDPTTPESLPEKKFDVILTMVTKSDGETVDKYRCREESVKQQFKQNGTDTSSDTDYFIQFNAKSSCHHSVKNQVEPQLEYSINLADLKEPDNLRMMHITQRDELLPNHDIFESRIFSKTV